jgi:hypothetical protein
MTDLLDRATAGVSTSSGVGGAAAASGEEIMRGSEISPGCFNCPNWRASPGGSRFYGPCGDEASGFFRALTSYVHICRRHPARRAAPGAKS